MYQRYREQQCRRSAACEDSAMTMEYGFLSPNCGLQVSKLCLGAMTFQKEKTKFVSRSSVQRGGRITKRTSATRVYGAASKF